MTMFYCFLLFGLISNTKGSAIIQVPSAGNCDEDTALTCQVTGSIVYTRWERFGRTLVTRGVSVRPEDQNKYTETRGTSSFKLTIHNTGINDEGDYRCSNGFYKSAPKRLNIECKASAATHRITSGKKVQITVDKIYPASPAITVAFKKQITTIQISGSRTCSSSTQYSGYFRCIWTSSNSLDDGLYTYSVVVTTITQASPLTGSFKIVSPESPSVANVVKINSSYEVLYGTEAQSLTIQCISNGGYPVPTVTWYKNSISNSNQLATTGTGTLQSDGTYTATLQHTFIPSTSEDRRYFICRSYYPQADRAHTGSNSKSVPLYLRLKPSKSTVTQMSVVSSGNVVTVHCRTTGCRPAANISWLYQGVKYEGSTTTIQNATTETFSVESTFTKQATAVDNGQSISCILTHPALVSPRELTESINLNVRFSVGPSTTQITGNKEIVATGSTALTLTCTTGSSNPASDITWKNGSQIINTDSSYITSAGENNGVVKSQELVLYPARYMDGNEIVCSVANTVSKSPVVDKVKLNLKYRPIIDPMSDVTVVEGNYSVLLCSATSKPPSTFKWFKTGQSTVLQQGTGTLNRNQLTYRIYNVRRSDASRYKCNANNGIENSDYKNVLLTVYYPPDVTVGGTNITVRDAIAIITCNADGIPNSNYRYGKWVQTWPGHSTPITERPGSEKLLLTDLTYEHSGSYTCSASNGIKIFGTNKEFIEGSLYILVKSFPIITKFNETITAKVQERLNVEIDYYSNTGASDIVLFKKVNDSRQKVQDYSLSKTKAVIDLPVFTHMVKTTGTMAVVSITIATKEDMGYYDFMLSNEVGSTVRSLEIVPKGPPEVPYNITVDNIQQTSARVSWQQGFHGGLDQTILIQLSTDRTHWENVETVFGGKDESKEPKYKTISGLKHSSTYFVRIYSFNREGNSLFSQYLNFTTLPFTESVVRDFSVAGIVGGTAAAVVVIALMIVIVVLVRRKTLTKEGIRFRFQKRSANKRNLNEDVQRVEMDMFPQDNTHEHHGTRSKNEKDEKNLRWKTLNKYFRNLYENLQFSAGSETADTYDDIQDQIGRRDSPIYENLKF